MRTGTFFAFVFLTLFLFLNPLYAGDQDWRQRPSAGDVVTTSDVAAEIEFGREVAARILGRYKMYENPVLVKYVNLVGLSLARNTNRPELEFRFMILDSSDINAYAAPGGFIFVTKGALQLVKEESELAGILAHEITHVTEKHIVKELNIKGSDDSATSGLARLVGGSSESARMAFAQAVDKALGMLFLDGYKKEDEVHADRTSVVISAMSGYDASALARYLERISTVKGKTREVLDRTHPAFPDRIALIKETIGQEGIDTVGGKTNRERFAEAIKSLK
jgi:predicted Zn-dependent protease